VPVLSADHLVSFAINPSLNGYDSVRAMSLVDSLIGVTALGLFEVV